MNNNLIRSGLYKKLIVIECSKMNDFYHKSEEFTLNFLIEKTNFLKVKLRIAKNIDLDEYLKIRIFNTWGFEIFDDNDFSNYLENEKSQSLIIFFTKGKYDIKYFRQCYI